LTAELAIKRKQIDKPSACLHPNIALILRI